MLGLTGDEPLYFLTPETPPIGTPVHAVVLESLRATFPALPWATDRSLE